MRKGLFVILLAVLASVCHAETYVAHVAKMDAFVNIIKDNNGAVTGEITGFEIDLWNAVVERIEGENNTSYKAVAWSQLKKDTIEGKADVLYFLGGKRIDRRC